MSLTFHTKKFPLLIARISTPIPFIAIAQETNEFAYINDNNDALLYRLHMIENAKEEIILSTFDFNPSESGKDIMASLIQASKRGVSVRIIVDGTSGFID